MLCLSPRINAISIFSYAAFLSSSTPSKIAKAEYGVNDKDVLDAIMCHTVAKENMSLFA